MTNTPLAHLQFIENQLELRFPHRNVLSEAIRKKLALSIRQRDLCEDLILRARQALRSSAGTQASAAQRSEFQLNLDLACKRVKQLDQIINRYLNAISQSQKLRKSAEESA